MTVSAPVAGDGSRADTEPWRGRPREWRRTRLHVVSGKGGSGKTTVAVALALALAAGGRRVLLVEVEQRQSVAALLGVAPLGYEERHLLDAPGGGDVVGLSVDPHDALMEYLALYYKVPRRAGGTLERIGAIDFATTVAPGLRDVLLTGKVYEATRRRVGEDLAYDAVVVDAPPTGRVARFLGVTTDVASLARIGPIHRQAQSIARLLRSNQTAVHLVALLEEMPAQETLDAVEALRATSLRVGATILNMVREPLLHPTELTAARAGELEGAAIAAHLASVGVDDPAMVDLLLDEAQAYAERVALQRRARRMLRGSGQPIYELPLLDGGVAAADVHDLAKSLRQQAGL